MNTDRNWSTKMSASPSESDIIFYIFWGFSEKNIFSTSTSTFGRYEDFVDIFLGHHKIGLVSGSFLCILRSFLKVKIQDTRYNLFIRKSIKDIRNTIE